MSTEHLLLCIFPVTVLVLMSIGIKFSPKGKMHEDFLSLENMKVLQGLAAVGVILHHCAQIATNYGKVWVGPISVFNDIGVIFTAIFFFCSGFGLITSYRSKPGYLNSFMRKRIPTVLLPFAISNLVYFVVIGLRFDMINGFADGVFCLTGFRLINRNTWFLVEILVLYLAFYFIFRFVKKEKAKWILMMLFVFIMITVSLLLGHEPASRRGFWFKGEWWYNTTLLFPLGMVVARFKENIVPFVRKNYLWLLPVFIVLFAVTLYVTEHWIVEVFGYYKEWEGHPGYMEKAVTALFHSLSCVFFVGTILLVSMKVRFRNGILTLLGKISLEMFIVHDLFRLTIVNSGAEISNVMLFIVVLGGGFVLALAMNWMDRRLIGFVIKPRKENVINQNQ